MVKIDTRASFALVGTVLKYLSVPLVFPLVLGLYYGDDAWVFAVTAGIVLVVGFALERLDEEPSLHGREAFLMVAVSWLAVSVVGALPYVLADAGAVAHPVNALFESMSGFTTTGATVMDDISFETHSRAVMMWRQLTQWLGGMGIIVLGVAILSRLSVGGAQLMEAETPGQGIEKLAPSIVQTARILWGLYFGLTVVLAALLYALNVVGLADGMTLYNAVAHALTTMPTGGFSPEARSIEVFSPAVQWTLAFFMLVAGTSFALIWTVFDERNPLALVRNGEFRLYVGILGAASALGGVLLYLGAGTDTVVGSVEGAVRESVFQFVSIVTTTGYASADFNFWGASAQLLLFAAMFVGGMVGSTGGGVKVLRWKVISKVLRRELYTVSHPDAVVPLRLSGRVLDEDAVRGALAFFVVYFIVFILGAVVIMEDSLRAGLNLTNFEALSASAALVGNIGPAFGVVGPMGGYGDFTNTTKMLMFAMMWMGRLEILPVLVVFTRPFWRE
ncbi:MAG: TrkH family potassium uptake protein [Halobacteriales archaeon]|nr:TrkH family potassium uptake protein [Halobacteriales archaeon]